MRKFGSAIFFFLLFIFASSCERADYGDEITMIYRKAKAELNNTSGIVIDGRMWSKPSKNELSWKDAVEYCKRLMEIGYSDWHLPTINELRTLMRNCPDTEPGGLCNLTDECLADEISAGYTLIYSECNSSDCSCIPDYKDEGLYSKLWDVGVLWSSTEAGNPEYAASAYFGYGELWTENKSIERLVRCVR